MIIFGIFDVPCVKAPQLFHGLMCFIPDCPTLRYHISLNKSSVVLKVERHSSVSKTFRLEEEKSVISVFGRNTWKDYMVSPRVGSGSTETECTLLFDVYSWTPSNMKYSQLDTSMAYRSYARGCDLSAVQHLVVRTLQPSQLHCLDAIKFWTLQPL
jgi:hypothetical protein